MKYQIYKIETFDAKSNGYSIGIREENWCVRLDCEIDNLDEAKEYVIQKNIQRSDLPLYLYNLSPTEKSKFIDEFCFSDDPMWVCKRRYFLGQVNKELIFKGLKNDGILLFEK